MAAYLIAMVEITDPDQYSKYIAVSPGVLEQYGGKFLVRGGEITNLEGDAGEKRVVVVEFESIDALKIFYDSPEYVAARGLRAGAADALMIAVPGYQP
ncbi:MAG: DUF1330 domain-containing protein [Pseudomonadota bacterium]